jgi:hypothetical protein
VEILVLHRENCEVINVKFLWYFSIDQITVLKCGEMCNTPLEALSCCIALQSDCAGSINAVRNGHIFVFNDSCCRHTCPLPKYISVHVCFQNINFVSGFGFLQYTLGHLLCYWILVMISYCRVVVRHATDRNCLFFTQFRLMQYHYSRTIKMYYLLSVYFN